MKRGGAGGCGVTGVLQNWTGVLSCVNLPGVQVSGVVRGYTCFAVVVVL